jgi:hypothetical protein
MSRRHDHDLDEAAMRALSELRAGDTGPRDGGPRDGGPRDGG